MNMAQNGGVDSESNELTEQHLLHFCERFRQPKLEWCDEAFIPIMAKLLGIDIIIVQEESKRNCRYTHYRTRKEGGPRATFVLSFSGCFNSGHYKPYVACVNEVPLHLEVEDALIEGRDVMLNIVAGRL